MLKNVNLIKLYLFPEWKWRREKEETNKSYAVWSAQCTYTVYMIRRWQRPLNAQSVQCAYVWVGIIPVTAKTTTTRISYYVKIALEQWKMTLAHASAISNQLFSSKYNLIIEKKKKKHLAMHQRTNDVITTQHNNNWDWFTYISVTICTQVQSSFFFQTSGRRLRNNPLTEEIKLIIFFATFFFFSHLTLARHFRYTLDTRTRVLG